MLTERGYKIKKIGAAVCLTIILLLLSSTLSNAQNGPVRSAETKNVSQVNSAPDLFAEASFKSLTGRASWYQYCIFYMDAGSPVLRSWCNDDALTCATRDFDRYSAIEVTNIDTGRSIRCRVTDYGPDAAIFPDRVVDLSPGLFRELSGSTSLGVLNVEIHSADMWGVGSNKVYLVY